MAPLLPVLSSFLEFTLSLRHHPVQQFLPWSSSSSLPLHSSLHYFSLKRVSSQQVSHPVSLSCSDCGYKRSFLSYQCYHFFVRYMFRPTDSFHSSPYPHFECLQSCYVHLSHCPCLCAVKGYAPNQRFNHSFLEASFQSSPQEFFQRISLFVPSSVTWEIREVVSRCLPPGVFSETPSLSVGDFHHPSFILLGSWISLIPARARSSTTHFVLNRVTT